MDAEEKRRGERAQLKIMSSLLGYYYAQYELYIKLIFCSIAAKDDADKMYTIFFSINQAGAETKKCF